MEALQWIKRISQWVWGPWMLVLLVGTGVFLTIRLKAYPWRNLGFALRAVFQKTKGRRGSGDISPFQSLMTSLAATIGTGNLVGVATAMVLGGPGALVWMWVSALFGLSTKFAESVLAVRYREKQPNGEMAGGPMYAMKNGFRRKALGKALAFLFSLFAAAAAFGIGNMTQANSIAEALYASTGAEAYLVGLCLMVLSGCVLLGGIRKLAAQTVPDLMQKFLATSGNEHTRFELHTESSFTADLLQAVAEERLDMAFVSHPGDDTVFENVAFARLPFVVVAPPNHPLAQKSSVTLRETLPYPFVYFSKRGGLRRPIDALFQKIGATPKIAYETEEDTVVAGMAAAGFGIAIVPDHPVLRCMDLKIILLTAPDPGRTAYLCRKREALQPAAAQRFFAFCQAQLSQGAAL